MLEIVVAVLSDEAGNVYFWSAATTGVAIIEPKLNASTKAMASLHIESYSKFMSTTS
jgi:hypothetical protein